MEKIWSACATDPHTHSFKKVADKQGVVLFFSQPAKAKRFNDHEGFIQHVDRALAAIGSRKWSCVLDGDGFDLSHAKEVGIGRALFELFLKKYAATLQNIHVINPTWHLDGILALAKATMAPEMFSKIQVMDDRKRSVMEFF